MSGKIESYLEDALGSGSLHIGEVIVRGAVGRFEILHAGDAGPEENHCDNVIDMFAPDLQVHSDPSDARRLARSDAEGNYRPLKSAPTLIRGWVFRLERIGEVREALENFYPGALGNWVAWMSGSGKPTALRDTLNRQTGMYRVTARATDDEADATVRSLCHPGCTKRILWGRTAEEPIPELPSVKLPPPRTPGTAETPLICYEACCLLVARLREVVKSRPSP